jgi:hypothetical protein
LNCGLTSPARLSAMRNNLRIASRDRVIEYRLHMAVDVASGAGARKPANGLYQRPEVRHAGIVTGDELAIDYR